MIWENGNKDKNSVETYLWKVISFQYCKIDLSFSCMYTNSAMQSLLFHLDFFQMHESQKFAQYVYFGYFFFLNGDLQFILVCLYFCVLNIDLVPIKTK